MGKPIAIVTHTTTDERGNIIAHATPVEQLHDIRVRAALNAPHKKTRPPVDERAEAWLRKHPDVYPEFKRFCYEAIMSGAKRLSADMVAHRIRWEAHVKWNKPDFKVNNDAIAAMARKFVADDPRQKDLFEFRKAPKKDSAEAA